MQTKVCGVAVGKLYLLTNLNGTLFGLIFIKFANGFMLGGYNKKAGEYVEPPVARMKNVVCLNNRGSHRRICVLIVKVVYIVWSEGTEAALSVAKESRTVSNTKTNDGMYVAYVVKVYSHERSPW